ncbi:sodium-coupled monocarboxylate transporter 1 [Harpegnathos saltator]|uniref:sodium-coupled monocarboxylate transporter 1 n=1 Tax=Harpegnathos saltator TaxID=610380 RepID=UPI00058F32E5|nr:sodium-coupled monocarboxylate transporter 1 [Harpegnathos saltator]
MENILTTSSPLNETDIFNRSSFGWLDYTFFCLVLLSSLAIGVYYGLFTKQDTTIEYLLAGRRMKNFPIAMSIAMSNFSTVTMIGIPTEVFLQGTQYSSFIYMSIISVIIIIHIFLPVFYNLQLTSLFEYLELRFNKSIRILSSLLFTLSLFLYVPIVIYGPALVFAQVTNLDIHIIILVISISCIVYTTIGGLKAVVFSDTLQFMICLIGLFAIIEMGLETIGGVKEVWRIADEGGRLIFFNMNPSPLERNSFWATTFGITATWLCHIGIHPGMVQRYLAVPTEKDAKLNIVISSLAIVTIQLIAIFVGLVIFAMYHNCDPMLTKAIKYPDQILSYYVMDVAGHLSGLPGLFVAALLSSGLAVLSTNLNTISGTIFEDFIRPYLSNNMKKEHIILNIMKGISVICGVLAVSLVLLVEKLGTIFQIGISMRSVTDGPLLGFFVLGTMVPWANAKGAMVGGCFSLVFMLWLVGGAEWYTINGRLKQPSLPTSMDGCPYPLNKTMSIATTMNPVETDPDEPMVLFQISFLYFALIGATIVVVIGTVASYFFGMNLKAVNPDHISPIMRRFLPPQRYTEVSLRETPLSDTSEQRSL